MTMVTVGIEDCRWNRMWCVVLHDFVPLDSHITLALAFLNYRDIPHDRYVRPDHCVLVGGRRNLCGEGPQQV